MQLGCHKDAVASKNPAPKILISAAGVEKHNSECTLVGVMSCLCENRHMWDFLCEETTRSATGKNLPEELADLR